jgi:hypothetical protein
VGTKRQQTAGPIRGRIGKRHAPADRSVVTNCPIRNLARDLLHQAAEGLGKFPVFNGGMRGQCTDSNAGPGCGNFL